MNKPMTWMLARRFGDWFVKPELEASFSQEEIVQAVELEPMLDLLERHLPADGKPRCAVDRETIALLRDHGRLS